MIKYVNGEFVKVGTAGQTLDQFHQDYQMENPRSTNVSPTLTDWQYNVGKTWINTDTDQYYVLIDNAQNNAVWVEVARNSPAINDITTNTTVTSSIKNNINTLNITGAVTLTIDDTSIVNIVAGDQIDFIWQSDTGSNTVTFATGGSQTIISEDSLLNIRAVGCAVTLIYLGSNTWSLIGALA
ncbi:hypothetical protein [Francisella marina]|uniref:hypothetical protein n=1 Tax=Francisella marina TaxID=2249302 RepID=UPI0011ED8867|nr:hypothetical protein [Francisella marina]QEO58339.1 hypothetical protein F0R75_00580 [Francisella marina]